jgi:hypothetical protein
MSRILAFLVDGLVDFVGVAAGVARGLLAESEPPNSSTSAQLPLMDLDRDPGAPRSAFL